MSSEHPATVACYVKLLPIRLCDWQKRLSPKRLAETSGLTSEQIMSFQYKRVCVCARVRSIWWKICKSETFRSAAVIRCQRNSVTEEEMDSWV